MKNIARFLVIALLVTLFVGCTSQGGQPAPTSKPQEKTATGDSKSALKSLVDAAGKEGELMMYTPASITQEGADALAGAFKKKYNLNVNVTNTPAGSMIRDSAKVVTEISSGSAPSWDVMVMNDAQYGILASNGALEKLDWANLGAVDPKAIAFDGRAVIFETQFVAPAYNTKLVQPEDVPKSWDDLLDAKWKGKLGVPSSTHHWARLAQFWGEQKTEKFMEGLAKQNPKLGTLPETYTSLQMGEISVAATMVDDYITRAKTSGAPVDFVPNIQPLIATNYMTGLMKGVKHPNLVKLFTLFLLEDEAQDVWQKYMGQTSMFKQGSAAWKFVQGKQVIILDPKFAVDRLDDLTTKYGRMVGYR